MRSSPSPASCAALRSSRVADAEAADFRALRALLLEVLQHDATRDSAAFGTFFLPGPTEVRREILEAMLAPMLPHRGAEFESMFARMVSLLQPIFRTTRPVFVSTSSATGFMEMSVRCAPPGPILSLVNGAFSERYADIASSVGREVTVLEGTWGDVVPLELVEAALRGRHYSALTVVHSETSTGALTPLPELSRARAAARHAGARGQRDGLGRRARGDRRVGHRRRAHRLAEGARAAAGARVRGGERPLHSRCGAMRRRAGATSTCWSSSCSPRSTRRRIRRRSRCSTPRSRRPRQLRVEGIEARWARHAAMAQYTQEWIAETREALGLDLRTIAREGVRSPTVTGISLPAGIRGEDVVAAVARRGFVIGGGYGRLKPTSIRIGHMGDHTVDGLSRCLEAVHDALRELT